MAISIWHILVLCLAVAFWGLVAYGIVVLIRWLLRKAG